jgi:hypothetical protein
LQGNAQSGGNYILEIDEDENINCEGFSSRCELFYKDKSNITITLRGIGANRTIRSIEYASGVGNFTVGSGVTLILDDNITLQGRNQNSALVEINNGGTFVMNEGSTITGNTNRHNSNMRKTTVNGAGVCVFAGGTFIMKGGTIYGNTIHPRKLSDSEIARAEQSANFFGREFKHDIHIAGGGVLVREGITEEANSGPFASKPAPSGTFIKTGGTITGYSSDPKNGNVIRDYEGNVVNGFGHAIFFVGEEPKAIDTTVGPEYSFNYSNGIFKEIRNESATKSE